MNLKRLPVIAIDEHSMITYCNTAFEREFGWSRDELPGQPLTALIPEMLHMGHVTGLSHFLASHNQELHINHADFSVIRNDGSEQWCEHHIVGKKVNGIWEFVAIIKPTPMPLRTTEPRTSEPTH